jgi:hypothetical protein
VKGNELMRSPSARRNWAHSDRCRRSGSRRAPRAPVRTSGPAGRRPVGRPQSVTSACSWANVCRRRA